MWSNPRVMNSISNGLILFVLTLCAFFALRALVRSPAFPLRVIQISGDARHVGYDDVAKALDGRLSGTFFTLDLDSVRGMFETIPWVRRAEVRRRWPDRLEIVIEEHRPLARWGSLADARLVNVNGELFSGRTTAELPVFGGPSGSEREVAKAFAQYRELLAPIGLEPREVVLSARYAWHLKLSNGLSVQLGRDSDKELASNRLSRFIEVYPRTLARLSRRLDYVDLRYPNGFALRVPGVEREDAGKGTRKKV
jgi:cell division protein FtsQ